jgi:predicted TIM-barrel fold metal-dependent hydrolase
MRREYEMTADDLATILEACKPVPYMVFGGRPPASPQENANAAWCELGRKMGFDGMTVEPVPAKGNRFFTAETKEN